MEREVGGGIGMGKTCKLKDVSFQCMTKFTTKKKKEEGLGHRHKFAQKEGEEKTWGRCISKLRRKASEEVNLADTFILNF